MWWQERHMWYDMLHILRIAFLWSYNTCMCKDLASHISTCAYNFSRSLLTLTYMLCMTASLAFIWVIFLTEFGTCNFPQEIIFLDVFLGCILQIEPKKAISLVYGSGAKVNFTFVQPSPFHPTKTHITARNLNSRAGAFHVHLFPKLPKMRVRTAGWKYWKYCACNGSRR